MILFLVVRIYATTLLPLLLLFFFYCSQMKSGHGKGPTEFEKLRILQDLSGEHVVCAQ